MLDIKVTKTTAPKAKPDEKHLGFGNHYTDHMFIMDYRGPWLALAAHRAVPFPGAGPGRAGVSLCAGVL